MNILATYFSKETSKASIRKVVVVVIIVVVVVVVGVVVKVIIIVVVVLDILGISDTRQRTADFSVEGTFQNEI